MKLSSLFRKLFAILILVIGVSASVNATHLRAGEITVERVSCNSLTFRITVTVFTNTIGTSVLFGGEDDWLYFGDGKRMLVPETQNTLRPDLGEGIATASFTIEYTYPGFDRYTISYSEPNRNEGVVNMDVSVNTRFYIETSIVIDPFYGCNNTPQLLVPPIDRACTGVAWFHNPGAYDPDGDSISYEMVIPFREKNLQVINYKDPNDPKFYTNFSTGNEEGTGSPTFSIHPTNGTLTWDAPGMAGEYNVAFIVKEWRKVRGQWYNTGFVRRDMQIIVDDCDNERPDLIIPNDICVEAGTLIDETIFGIDPDDDPVYIEAFSEIFNLAPAQSPATWKPDDGVFRPSNPPAELQFQWQTECIHVKDQPYQVSFKITDKSPTGSKLVTFKTWFIRVVGPKPVWENVQVNLQTRVASLEWDPYTCKNAETMQIWRRVDSFAFEPDSCQTGMPDFLGYQLINTVSLKTSGTTPITTYTDNNGGAGLAPGAQYCYRLVAVFPLPRGGESYVSEEICLDPIEVDEPVITNVSVQKTHITDGEIFIKWTKPFEINRTQFPGPFEYEVFQAEGFAGDGNLTKVNSGRLSEDDTTFVATGLNTKDVIYNYRIKLFSPSSQTPTPAEVAVSVPASMVRLDAKGEAAKIILSWSAFVPWSNIVQTTPNGHELYKGPDGATEDQLVLLQTIDPVTNGLTYTDEGLSDTDRFCYRVLTRGAYGNPQIPEPLENFSQIVCAQPKDPDPPCAPVLIVKQTDCDLFLQNEPCDISSFQNVLTWVRPTCADDIIGYKIYRASEKGGDYVQLFNAGIDGIVRDTFYIDNGQNGTGLPSMAFCYRITAIDQSGNESLEPSEPACNDNCPYYELPNVFSPGDNNPCNDVFGAWKMRNSYVEGGESGELLCGEVDGTKCARFVSAVELRVYNRWGKEIYSYRSGGERSIYIDWDGRDDEGRELASGVYYYIADVTFQSVDPAKRNQSIKGWVHLMR